MTSSKRKWSTTVIWQSRRRNALVRACTMALTALPCSNGDTVISIPSKRQQCKPLDLSGSHPGLSWWSYRISACWWSCRTARYYKQPGAIIHFQCEPIVIKAPLQGVTKAKPLSLHFPFPDRKWHVSADIYKSARPLIRISDWMLERLPLCSSTYSMSAKHAKGPTLLLSYEWHFHPGQLDGIRISQSLQKSNSQRIPMHSQCNSVNLDLRWMSQVFLCSHKSSSWEPVRIAAHSFTAHGAERF